MPAPRDDTPLERLSKRLYAPQSIDSSNQNILPERLAPKHGGWHQESVQAPGPEKPKLAPSVVFLFVAFGFFVIAGSVATALLFLGGRSVSTDKVKISVEGPTTIAGGDTLSLLVTIYNQNPVAVTKGNLSLVFPEGTYSTEDTGLPLSHYAIDIGDIPAGGSVKKTIRAVVFGNEDQVVRIPMTFEYQTSQSSAVFQKPDEYGFTIGTSPVDVTVTTLSEVASGQELTVSVSVRSNAAKSLDTIGVMVNLPFGFALNSALPTPAHGSFFVFPHIEPGEEAKITLTGVLSGQDSDDRVFRFDVGAVDAENPRQLGVVFTTKEATVTITRPFLAVSLLLNREETEPTIIQAGTPIQALLSWSNTLSSTILDGELQVRLQGASLDQSSISSSNGFYRSSDTTVLFSKETDTGLKNFQSGDSGNGTFSFTTKTGSEIASLRNPTIVLTISVKGRRVTESSVAESISSTITRTLQIASDLKVTPRAVYSVGPFKNTGPWPPKVNQETTYTIVLSGSNTVNSVAGAKARMTLPSYVRFTGAISPNDGKLSYNETTREVTWDIGDMPAGTSGRDVAFQVALLPSASQTGKSPVLVGAEVVTGFDRFVQRELTYTVPSLTTRAETDPGYEYSFGNVIP